MPDQRATNGDFSLAVDADGIVELTWAAGIHVSAAVARDAVAAVNEICVDDPRPLLVTMVAVGGLSREGRAVFEEPNQVSRLALLGRSPVDRVIANFILALMRPPSPMRYFTDRGLALAFLREGLAGGGSSDAG